MREGEGEKERRTGAALGTVKEDEGGVCVWR